MANIHDQARKFMAGKGVSLTDAQKKAVFLFADFVLQTKRQPTKRALDAFPMDGKSRCPECTAKYHHSRNCTRQ